MAKKKSKKGSKSLSTQQRTIIVLIVLGLIFFLVFSSLGLCGICAFLTPSSSENQESGEDVAGVVIETAPPTNLEVVSELGETTDESVVIEGYVDTSTLQVMINDTEARLEEKDGKKYFSASMPLEVGTNEFIITSYNQNGEKDEERKIVITRQQLYKVLEVVDGDTIKIDYEGKSESVRLIGIDTPETEECFNGKATEKMGLLVEGKEVRVEFDETQGERDKYSRLLLYIWQGDIFVNEVMVRDGFAHEYTYNLPYKYMDQFKEAQKEASEARRGLWGDVCACQEGEETGRTCIACHKAKVTRSHWDCSTYTQDVTDNGCTSGCYTPPPAPAPAPVPEKVCCKICRKGKACGDSCISRSYTCHKPPGCACDG